MNTLLKFTVFVLLFFQPTAVTATPTQSQTESSVQRKAEELDPEELFAVFEFSGNRAFSSEELEEMLNSQTTLSSFYKLGKSPLPLPEGIQNIKDHLERLRFLLGTKGYLRAKIGEPQIEKLSEQVVKVTVPIEEGACYRIGKIAVKGAKAISSGEVVEISGLRYGEPINAASIQEKIFTGIKNEYANRGFIQASIDFIPDFKLVHLFATEGIVDVTLEVDEGRMFYVENVEFTSKLPGLAKANKEMLFDCLLLTEGNVYSQKLLNETLKNLNRLGWLEEVRDKDVIVRTNDREPMLQINIQVKEIGSSRK